MPTDATFQAGKQCQIIIFNVVKNMDLRELRKDHGVVCGRPVALVMSVWSGL